MNQLPLESWLGFVCVLNILFLDMVSLGNDDLSNSTSEVSSSFIKDSLKILIFWLGEEK